MKTGMRRTVVNANRFRLAGDSFARSDDHSIESKRVIFISTEGTETEPGYFRLLNERLKARRRDCPYVLHVLEHRHDTNSSPNHVLGLLEECKAVRQGGHLFKDIARMANRLLTAKRIEAFFNHPDRLSSAQRSEVQTVIEKLGIDIDYWHYLRAIGGSTSYDDDLFAVVIDRDRKCHTRESLKEILDACVEKRIDFCLSNPCFELWLILHFEYHLTPQDRRRLQANERCSDAHSYAGKLLSTLVRQKKNVRATDFNRLYLPKTRIAMKKAEKLASSPVAVLDEIGTTVPVLVKRFLEWI